MTEFIRIGRDLIKSSLLDIPAKSGIYKMLNADKEIIYIGKAKNLKKRVSNYANSELTTRALRMVSQIHSIEFIVTQSEATAFLLEAQLIKKVQPKFNILLKDDKTFPYIKLRLDHDYPQVIKYRGKILKTDKVFGPFAASYLVNSTIDEIYKIFKLRSCSDNYFATRTRPCLQYEIKRCSAPCVNKITKEDYLELVNQTEKFLNGDSSTLQTQLAKKMEQLSEHFRYEEAAQIRDRIKALSYVQLKNNITLTAISNVDVIVIIKDKNIYCIQVFIYRGGKSYGNKTYFPAHTENVETNEVLESFLGQFYQNKTPPQEIILNHQILNQDVFIEALKQLSGIKISIKIPVKGDRFKLVQNACENAKLALEHHHKNSVKNNIILNQLQELFNLPASPERIEVYDNSHIMGTFAVGAMVVAGGEGFEKKEYRIFNIELPSFKEYGPQGDDYGMLKCVLEKRFNKIKNEKGKIPDLMIIDGGKGHAGIVSKALKEFALNIPYVCMSKGPCRNAGNEQFHLPTGEVFTLDKSTPVMKYLQVLRDEAHNYAITKHRKRRSDAIKVSSLDAIDLIGKVRKKALLNYFGDFRAIKEAALDELEKAPGISKAVAKKIFDALH